MSRAATAGSGEARLEIRKTRESVTRVYEVLGAQPCQVDSAAPLFAPGVLEVHFVNGEFTRATLRASTADTRPGDLWADGLLSGDLPGWAKPLIRYEDGCPFSVELVCSH